MINSFRYFKIFLFFFPIAWSIYYVYLFGVNVPTHDEWDFTIRSLQKFKEGNLSFKHLFSFHNEHRSFFSRIVMLVIAILTDYSNRAEMFVTQFFLLINILIFYLKLKKQFFLSLVNWPLWFALIPSIVLSSAFFTFMLWGIGLTLIMEVSAVIASLFLLDTLFKTQNYRFKNFIFLQAVLCAIIASFSSACGVFVWISGIFILWVLYLNKNNEFEKKYLIYLIVWVLTGVFCWILYFHDFTPKAQHTSPLYSLGHPEMLFNYFLALLGGALSKKVNIAYNIGLFLIVFNIFNIILIIKYKKFKRSIFWISLSSFLLLLLFSIALGRSKFGPAQALSPRYSAFVLPFIVSSLVLFVSIIEKKRIFKYIFYPVIMVLLFSSILKTYDDGFENGRKHAQERKKAAHYLLTSDSRSSNDLKIVYAHGGVYIRSRIKFLKEHKLNIFDR